MADTWKIHSVFVLPEWRGRGLAIELLNYVFQKLREMGVHEVTLKVDQTNESAVRLYEKCGFVKKAEMNEQIVFVKTVV